MNLTDDELIRAVYANPDEFDGATVELAKRLDRALEDIARLELKIETLERKQRES